MRAAHAYRLTLNFCERPLLWPLIGRITTMDTKYCAVAYCNDPAQITLMELCPARGLALRTSAVASFQT